MTHGTRWTAHEDKTLTEHRDKSVKELMEHIPGRTKNAIEVRISKLFPDRRGVLRPKVMDTLPAIIDFDLYAWRMGWELKTEADPNIRLEAEYKKRWRKSA